MPQHIEVLNKCQSLLLSLLLTAWQPGSSMARGSKAENILMWQATHTQRLYCGNKSERPFWWKHPRERAGLSECHFPFPLQSIGCSWFYWLKLDNGNKRAGEGSSYSFLWGSEKSILPEPLSCFPRNTQKLCAPKRLEWIDSFQLSVKERLTPRAPDTAHVIWDSSEGCSRLLESGILQPANIRISCAMLAKEPTKRPPSGQYALEEVRSTKRSKHYKLM